MKTKNKEINNYEKKYINTKTNYVSISDFRELDIETVLKKIENEIISKKNKLKEKGSAFAKITIGSFAFNANFNIKRLETDIEYNARIAKYEKQEETKRKKEEEKIKKDFLKLAELKEKYKEFANPDEAIMAQRKNKTEKSIISIKD